MQQCEAVCPMIIPKYFSNPDGSLVRFQICSQIPYTLNLYASKSFYAKNGHINMTFGKKCDAAPDGQRH